jgi:hypothetical protein
MAEYIKIEITIPDYEYKNWSDYYDGIDEVMANLKKDIRERLKQDYIRQFNIEVSLENN